MLQSHIIDIDGLFTGAAIRLGRGYRFLTTNLRVEELDESIWPTLADVQHPARRIYMSESFGAQPTSQTVPIPRAIA